MPVASMKVRPWCGSCEDGARRGYEGDVGGLVGDESRHGAGGSCVQTCAVTGEDEAVGGGAIVCVWRVGSVRMRFDAEDVVVFDVGCRLAGLELCQ